ncbi:mitogen-activated protein kinase kinase kinase kinase 4 isoform X3 [Odontomachus brunneus]|nr:mitogen-activated protein kinase kinase kinase kinase 4 isoform X3 [Odontomachus brunneus]
MTGRTSLVEQKRVQWAREREEMARLGVNWGPVKPSNCNRTHIRTFSNDVRLSFGEAKDKTSVQPFRAAGHYGSTASLKSLTTENSGNGNASLKCLDYNGGSLINLRDQVDASQIRRRSPSLPPIFNKEQQQYFCQLEQQRDFGVEGSRYQQTRSQKPEHHRHRTNNDQRRGTQKESLHHYGSPGEEREGETSGYASDSVDVPSQGQRALAGGKMARIEMTEKTWQNPYCTTPESSLPPSRRLSPGRMGELNRPRWGSVWGQDAARGDPPPPPSWLSRLGQSSQVLVINHDSASSPDSSTTGSTGSDNNKTYLRGHNIPVDADILQEREARRQKALQLQNAIKQQLEEKDRQRKEEKERRMREERLEDERIRREQEKEKERFEEEQRLIREKETAKLKKAQAMREVLEAAERLAREEKKNRRKREDHTDEDTDVTQTSSSVGLNMIVNADDKREQDHSQTQTRATNLIPDYSTNEKPDPKNTKETERQSHESEKIRDDNREQKMNKSEQIALDPRESLQVPVSKDVAIVLSGRLDDPEILSRANLQLVNLQLVTPSPRRFDNATRGLSLGLSTIMKNNVATMLSPRNPRRCSPRSDSASIVVENRLLTPSKYRTSAGRDFGTQTDVESDLQELRDKLQDSSIREHGGTAKDRKDTTNASRRNVEKSTNMGPGEEVGMKALPRSKSQPRTTLDARPRWNANRYTLSPGTRYRTQSEKDPHYQRRLRLRRRRVESSDEGSR